MENKEIIDEELFESKPKLSYAGKTVIYTIIINVLLIAAVLISSLLIFLKTYEFAETNALNSQLNETHILAEELNTWVSEYAVLMKELAKDVAYYTPKEKDAVQESFQKALYGHENILLYFAVYEDNSSVWSDYWEAPLDYDYEVCPFYTEPRKNNQFTYVEPEWDVVSEKMVIIMGMPVFDENGVRKAIFGNYINLDDVVAKISTLNENADEYRYTFLIDGSGNIIAHPNKNYIQTEDVRINMRDLTDSQYDKLYTAFIENNEKITSLNKNGYITYFTASCVGDTGWTLIQATPQADVFSFITDMSGYIVLVLLACLIISVSVTVLIFSRIGKEIEELTLAKEGLSEDE